MVASQSGNNYNYSTASEPEQNVKYMEKYCTPLFRINSVDSLTRNRKFLKDLELAKARLRTYAAYTPTDRELQQRVAEYQKQLQRYAQNFISS